MVGKHNDSESSNTHGWVRQGAGGLGVLVVFALIIGVVTQRDTVHDGVLFDEAAKIVHVDHEARLDLIESPERIIQFAQAAKAVEEVEKAVKRAQENAAAIQIIKLTQQHQAGNLSRIEAAQADAALTSREILRRLPVAPSTP